MLCCAIQEAHDIRHDYEHSGDYSKDYEKVSTKTQHEAFRHILCIIPGYLLPAQYTSMLDAWNAAGLGI
jgi:hypothetical protein